MKLLGALISAIAFAFCLLLYWLSGRDFVRSDGLALAVFMAAVFSGCVYVVAIEEWLGSER